MNEPVVFVNYRRADTSWPAEYIVEKLRGVLSHENVFFDCRSIEAGDSISDSLIEGLEKSTHLLVVIGPDWIKVQDQSGRRRVDLPEDWVRLEIKMALELSTCTVIPVLLDDACLPEKEHLPDEISFLSNCKELRVRSEQKESDLDKLIEIIVGNAPPSAGARVVYERLSRRGRIDLSVLSNPYNIEYDPDGWQERKSSVFVCFPKVDYVNNAPRTEQLPAVVVCFDLNANTSVQDYLSSDLYEKLLTFSPAKLFNDDKVKILNELKPLINCGFVAGVTLPVRLFSSDVVSRKQKYLYGAMINSVLVPTLRYHNRIEYEVDVLKFASVGNDKFDSKLIKIINSEIGIDISKLEDLEIEAVLRLINWCVGSAVNTKNKRWIQLLQND